MAYANLTVSFPGYPLATGKIGLDALVPNLPQRTTHVCPDCSEPTKLTQPYVCENGHGPFRQSEAAKAITLNGSDKELVPFTPDDDVNDLFFDIGDDDKGQAPFRAYPAAQVASAGFRPGKNQYHISPVSKATKQDKQMWAILRALAAQDTVSEDADEGTEPYVWLTRWRFKDSVGTYRLTRDGDQVLLTELVHPDQCRSFDKIDVGIDDDVAEASAATLLEHCAEDTLDLDDYASHAYDNVMAWAQARWDEADGELTVTAPTATVDDADDGLDLAAMLAASLPGADDESEARDAAKGRHPAAAAATGADLLMAAMAHVEAGGDPADFQAAQAS